MPEFRAGIALELGVHSAPSDEVVDGENPVPYWVFRLALCYPEAVVAGVLGIDVDGEHMRRCRSVD